MKKLLFFASLLMLPLIASAQTPFWHQTSGPEGGTVNDLCIDSSGRVIVWTRGSGVYRSTDNGASWHLLNQGLPNLNMYHGAAGKSGYLYGINSARDGQVFRFDETNSNAIWEEITPYQDTAIFGANDIVADPDGTVYIAAGSHGVLRSDENGKNWQEKGQLVDTVSPLPNVTIDKNVVLVTIDGKGNLFAGMEKGRIFRSGDKGETWTKLPVRNPDGRATLSTMVALPNGNIVIGTDHPTFGTSGHIYTSVDSAKTWLLEYTRPVNTEEAKDDIDKIIRVPGSNILYANAHGPTLRSSDNGLSWSLMDSNKRGDEVFSMAALGNNLFQICEPDGVFLSTNNGANWEERNHQLFAEYMWGIAINSKQELFGVTEYGLWYSGNNGNTWEMKPEYGEDYSPSIWIDKRDNIFIGTTKGLFRSEDNGETLKNIIFNDDTDIHLNTINQVADNGHGKLYCASNIDTVGFVYSLDEGNTWTKVTGIPDQTGQRHVEAFAFATIDTILVARGTAGSTDFYSTTDNGVTWQYIGNNHDTIASQVLIHPDGSYLMRELGVLGGIFRSTDGARSWKKIFPPGEGTIKPTDYFSMMVDDKGSILVTTNMGVFRSAVGDPNFSAWFSISEGLSANDFPGHFVNVSSIVENPVTHVYFAATRGLGVYESIPNLGVAASLPVAPEILAVYPNPAGATVTITFSPARNMAGTLELYDILGRKIKTIYSGVFQSGNNVFSFDASALPNGNYMLSLNSDGKIITSWMTTAR